MSALCAALKCQTRLLHRLENPLGVFYKLGYYHKDYCILPGQVSTSFYKFQQISTSFYNLSIYQGSTSFYKYLQVSTIYQSTNLPIYACFLQSTQWFVEKDGYNSLNSMIQVIRLFLLELLLIYRSFLCLCSSTTLPEIFLHIKTSLMEFFDVWTNYWTQEKKERKKESKGGGGYTVR